jgi:MSHA biogenesis protein MshP
MKPMRSGQHGVALISAIFLIVVLAMLGLTMVSLSGVQHATISQAIVAARVYYGAKAGLDWGIHRAVGLSSCSATTNLAAITGLDSIAVTVQCTCTFSLSGCVTSADSVYYVISTATYRTYGNHDYAQRVLEATITNQ